MSHSVPPIIEVGLIDCSAEHAASKTSTPQRQELGFVRTVCDCRKCSVFCEHIPGYLIPSDLERLIPAGGDPFTWAEEHLRASRGFVGLSPRGFEWVPSLVPKKGVGGHCHWLVEGRCAVHADAPYGCAFLDQHMTDFEAHQRSAAGKDARKSNFETDGLYARVWQHLLDKGLTYESSTEDRRKVQIALRSINRREEDRVEREVRRDRKRKERRRRKQSRR